MSQNVNSSTMNFSEFEKTRKILNISHYYNYTQKNNKLYLIQDVSKFNAKNVLWTLLNPTLKNFHGFKAKDKDIAKICHTMIDLDSPTQPQAAIDFAEQLLQHPFVKKYLPEHSSILATGGGARILVSIEPLENTPSNLEAFKITMKQFIQKIDNIRKQLHFDTVSIDSTFDISRVYALAGSYRPYKPHKHDHESLKNGFVLYWHTPLHVQYATALREKIVAVSAISKTQKIQIKKEKKEKQYTPQIERSFIEEMLYDIQSKEAMTLARNLARKYYGKNYKNNIKDRSRAFSKIINAVAAIKGEEFAITYSHIIDIVTGEKYQQRAEKNAKNLMKTFVKYEDTKQKKKRRVICQTFQKEMLYKWFHAQIKHNETTFTPTAILYDIYASTVKKPLSRKQFTQLLKAQGYISKQHWIDGVMTRCIEGVQIIPHKHHTFSPRETKRCILIYMSVIYAMKVMRPVFIDLCSLPSG